MVGQEVVYLRSMLQGFGCKQLNPTEVWEDNVACIQIANNQDRDLVRDEVMILVKCARKHNVADALTKSLQGPAWTTHHPYLTGTRHEYKAFFTGLGITETSAVAWASV
eukprot:924639-Rhodomonas_salina.1